MIETETIETETIEAMVSTRSLLFLNRHAPHGTIHAQEALDAVLMASAFEPHIELLFIDDGVFQLLAGQLPEEAGLKNFSAAFRALQMYDIEDVYVDRESLQVRGLQAQDLLLAVKLLNRQQCEDKLEMADVVLSF